jgi:uncharacterized protein YbjQ (UPF0145 family)
MRVLKLTAIAAVAAMAVAQPVLAKKTPRTYVVNNEAVGVPVFPHDITDRPYTVIGEVKAKVRKATVFSKAASQKKIYRELWERARKKGADAVINANYGDSKISAMSWGQTNARGTAIRFNTTAASTSN